MKSLLEITKEQFDAAIHEEVATIMEEAEKQLKTKLDAYGIRLTDTHGLLSWYELAGVFKRALFVVGNDTGPSHLAAHIGTQGLALFGNYSPAERTGIIRENFGVIEVEDLAALPAERVFDEVTRRIEAHSNSV